MAYRVLIIGCGAIAGGYDEGRPEGASPLTHAGAFSADQRFALAACVDPDDSARSGFAERWGIERHAATLDDLGAEPGDFDVVSVCSPTVFHAEHLDAALALQPRLIFCEKPVAGDLDAAAARVTACKNAGVALAINYTRRWAPDLMALAEDVRAGKWGRILSATGWYTKGVVHNGAHMVDLLHMFLDELDMAYFGPPTYDFWDEDPTVPMALTGPDGETIHLLPGDARAFTQFELVLTCEQGEIAMRDGGFRIETRCVEASETFAGYRTLGERKSVPGRYDEAMTCAVANIAGHLDHAKPLASTGKNALAAQALCEAARQYSTHRYKEYKRP